MHAAIKCNILKFLQSFWLFQEDILSVSTVHHCYDTSYCTRNHSNTINVMGHYGAVHNMADSPSYCIWWSSSGSTFCGRRSGTLDKHSRRNQTGHFHDPQKGSASSLLSKFGTKRQKMLALERPTRHWLACRKHPARIKDKLCGEISAETEPQNPWVQLKADLIRAEGGWGWTPDCVCVQLDFLRSVRFRAFLGVHNPCCDAPHAHSRLHTQARSIIQMSDEQNSQYVGMLYWVDLKMWPLCSSTCREQQSKGSLPVQPFTFLCIFYILFYSALRCVYMLLFQGAKEGAKDCYQWWDWGETYNVSVLFPPFLAFRFWNLLQ